MALVDERPHLHGRIKTVTDLERPRALHELLHEVFVHVLMHRDAAGGGATLPGGSEAAPDGAVHGKVQVSVLHHQDDVLAAHGHSQYLSLQALALAAAAGHLAHVALYLLAHHLALGLGELAHRLGHCLAGLAAGGAAGTTELEDDIRRLLDVHTRSFQATRTAASRSANVNSAQLLAR